MPTMTWWDVVILTRRDFDGDRYDAATYTYRTASEAVERARGEKNNGCDAVLVFKRTRDIEEIKIV
jgi:hypothetical protein